MSSCKLSVTKQIRSERRKAAEKRQEEYDKLSLEQKLARLPENGAKKQRARIEKLLEDRKANKQ